MIRSLPFTPTVVFTAPPQPRRESAREPESKPSADQDAFNRMLVRQREEARLTHRLREAAQASASDSIAPATDAAPADATKTAPAEAVRTANRSAVRQGTDADKPAQIDPEMPVDEARHGRKAPGHEADLLARLFKTAQKALPPKQAPFGPEGPPEENPGESPLSGPLGSSKTKSALPVIECPCEPTMSAHAQSTAPAARSETGTQALQNRDAADAMAASGRVDPQTGAGATGGTGGTASAGTGPEAAPAAGSATADGASGAPALSTPVDAAAGPAAPTADSTAPGTPLASALAGTPAQTGAALAPRQASLDARPGTEAFEMKFSAQVAVWVREGVHEAQLQLNPADMGPVRVAILLEGAAAQVNFTAEHALTRQALEQALPTLAGSLAEAGFTLAGGGVFDQPRQPERSAGDDERRPAGTGPAGAGSEADAGARAPVARPRGVVDLVA